MAKPQGQQVPDRYWRGGKSPEGVEYYHEPSRRAQSLWLYLVSIGKAIAPAGSSHGHNAEAKFLIHYVRRGEFWYRLGRQRFLLKPGAVFLMDLRGAVRYGNDGPDTAHVWWVCFGGKEAPGMFTELAADQEPLFEGLDRSEFERLFNELMKLTRWKPPGYEAKASGLLQLLLAELFAMRDAGGWVNVDLVGLSKRANEFSQPVRNTIRYMARFYDYSLDLKKLYSVSGLSMYHFSRLFHRETGMSPMQYFNHYRVEKAKLILQNSDRSVAEVGEMVGIKNPFKFSRLFHKLVGQTPSQFQKQAKAG